MGHYLLDTQYLCNTGKINYETGKKLKENGEKLHERRGKTHLLGFLDPDPFFSAVSGSVK